MITLSLITDLHTLLFKWLSFIKQENLFAIQKKELDALKKSEIPSPTVSKSPVEIIKTPKEPKNANLGTPKTPLSGKL